MSKIHVSNLLASLNGDILRIVLAVLKVVIAEEGDLVVEQYEEVAVVEVL